MAAKLGMTLPEFLEMLGPIPMPPAGYTSAKGGSRWIGEDITRRGWIITPAWNATTNTHSIELWTANHEPPRYADLSTADALQLAADLTAVAQSISSHT